MLLKMVLVILTVLFGGISTSHAENSWQSPYLYEDAYGPLGGIDNAIGNANTKPEQLGTILRIDFDDIREVPALFSQYLPGKDFDRPRGISVYLALTNDFNVLRPVGFGERTDDYGYTHGSKITIGGYLPSGHYMTFEYSSDLYTKRIDGTARRLPDGGEYIDQNFTNENVLKIVLDNIDNNRSKTFYWKAEAGWQRLNSESRGGVLSGATQQEKVHALINKVKPDQTKTPVYVDDGKGVRDGAILGLYVGIAKEYLNAKNTCRLRAFTEVGPRGSTINDASYVAAKVGGILWCQQSAKAMTYRGELGHESKGFQHGYQGTGYADISAGKGNWRIGFRVEKSHGDLINYVNYNLENNDSGKIDAIFTIYYSYYFD